MKKLLWACVLALPILALPNAARAFMIGNYEVDTGAKVWCNVRQFNIATPTAGPWYLYYPYQAYFQAPAPGVSPYFPPPMMLPPGFGGPPPGAPGYGGPPPMPPAQAYQQQMPPAQAYQGQVPPGQGYPRQVPPGAQGYYPRPSQGPQAYQPMGQTPAYQYRAPAPTGIPHPDVFSYYSR